MMNIIAVDSLRTLPFSASLGSALIFYYLLAALGFFIPSAYLTTQLVKQFPEKAGIYSWVRAAFGELAGFIVIWFQWVYNLIWFPSILSFLAATSAYFIFPSLANNKFFIFTTVTTFFWAATFLNCLGLRVSALMSTLGALVGTLLPMIGLILLSLIWVCSHHPIQIHFTYSTLIPNLSQFHNQAYLLVILFGLLGIESSAVHIDQVSNPARSYPRAIFISALVILVSLILSSLAIAIVVPSEQLNVITGLTDAFEIFLQSFNLAWLMPIITLLILFGGLACMTIWVINPTKALYTSAQDQLAPKIFAASNRHGAPIFLLLLQGVVTTLFSSAFIFMPSVSAAYWLLTAMTAQLAILVYLILFFAALRLAITKQLASRWVMPVAMTGIISCLIAISLGFIPPAGIQIGSLVHYELELLTGLCLLSLPPFLIYAYKKQQFKLASQASH